MFAVVRLIEGLLVAHAFLLASFLVGASTFPRTNDASNSFSASRIMMHNLCICAAGIAIITLALFALGLAGWLRPVPIVVTFFAIISLACAARRSSPFSLAYWRPSFEALCKGWDGPLLLMYYVMLAVAAPAVIPNVGGDPIHYHFPYAVDWVQNGRIVVDTYLRFPFYANNFSLLYAMLMTLGGESFLNFFVWAMGLLVALGICSTSRDALERDVSSFWSATISVALALAFVSSATYLRWGFTGYYDAGQAAAALLSTVAFRLAIIERRRVWLFVGAIAVGFLIGVKGSYLVLLPLYLGACVFAVANLKMRARDGMLLVGVLLVFATPWYVRNTVLSGDPLFPAVNLTLYGSDGLFTKVEYESIQHDFQTAKSLRAFISLPWRAFMHPNTPDFREFGTTALMLALFVPGAILLGMFCLGKRTDAAWALPVFLLSAIIVYWFVTASYLRYSTIFYPLLAVCCAFMAALLLKRFPKAAPAVALLAILAMIPTPGSAYWYADTLKNDYLQLPKRYTDDESYLRLYEDGYIEAEFASAVLEKNHLEPSIYVLGGATEYYFRMHHIRVMGEWVGLGGYLRLMPAIDAGASADFMKALDAGAVLLDPHFTATGLEPAFQQQLIAAGYCNIVIPHSRYQFLVRPPCKDVKPPE